MGTRDRPVGAVGAMPGAVAVALGAAVILGPPALVSLVVTVCVIASRTRRHWHEVAAAGCAGVVVGGVVLWVLSGHPVAEHFSGLWVWLSSPTLSPVGIARDSLAAMPVGVPGGVVLGAVVIGLGEARAAGAEFHPLEMRRQAVTTARVSAGVRRVLADTELHARCPVAPLGAVIDGDLRWRSGPLATVAEHLRLSFAVVGAAGSGKTESLVRLVEGWAALGRKVVFLDGKGTDPDLPRRVTAAYIQGSGRADVRVHWFARQALNGWVGRGDDIANRLLATIKVTEPYYEDAGEGAVRLAVDAGGAPPRSSAEFLSRLNPAFLTAAYKGTPDEHQAEVLAKEASVLRGVMLRFWALFKALRGAFDGTASYGDADLVFMSVPSMAAKKQADAVIRFLLSDFAQFCTDPARKPRLGADVVLVIDEASAFSGFSDGVKDLAERVRDAGGMVVVSVQSFEGLGDTEDDRLRLSNALAGGVLLHRCNDPEKLLTHVGSERTSERSWQLEKHTGSSGMGSLRMAWHYKVNPEQVRQARVGEAWMLHGGRFCHMQVIPAAPGAQAMKSSDASLKRCKKSGATEEPPTQEPPDQIDDPRPAPTAEEGTDSPPERPKRKWFDDDEANSDT